MWLRDGGRCQWPVASGGICGSTTRVEFDHIVPLARGGSSTVGGLRLLCRRHNFIHAEQTYGREHMARFVSRAGLSERPEGNGSTLAGMGGGEAEATGPTFEGATEFT